MVQHVRDGTALWNQQKAFYDAGGTVDRSGDEPVWKDRKGKIVDLPGTGGSRDKDDDDDPRDQKDRRR